LRGITIQGIGLGGGTGLVFNSGFSLTLANSVIRNHTGNGIEIRPGATSHLSILNTLVADNGGHGILVQPGNAGTAKVALRGVGLLNNSKDGLSLSATVAGPNIRATVRDSLAAHNSSFGFSCNGGPAGGITLMMTASESSNNGGGIFSGGIGCTVIVGQSVVTENATGLQSANSTGPSSYGDNDVNGNDSDGVFLGSVTKK